ncbi:MAG TPA: single-stranded DNA-binding protein [Geminicoccaceae bacterium]|nr:single-stranded DNA-binding protein [Geminicoccaceae bacterium]
MANVNRVLLLGRLTRDVELRYSQGGTAVAKFGMAINRQHTGKDGEKREETCFVDLVAFGKQAEVLNQYLAKGRELFVEGRLSFSSWEAQDGTTRSKLEVAVESFQFVGGKDQESAGKRQAKAAPAQDAEPDYGDIPF